MMHDSQGIKHATAVSSEPKADTSMTIPLSMPKIGDTSISGARVTRDAHQRVRLKERLLSI